MECSYTVPWCDLNLTFNLAVVALNLKTMSRLYVKKHKIQEVDTW